MNDIQVTPKKCRCSCHVKRECQSCHLAIPQGRYRKYCSPGCARKMNAIRSLERYHQQSYVGKGLENFTDKDVEESKTDPVFWTKIARRDCGGGFLASAESIIPALPVLVRQHATEHE